MQHERNVIHEDEAEVLERPHGETFAGQGTLLGAAAGSENLGCTLFEVPPDRSPVPYHYHNVTRKRSTSSKEREPSEEIQGKKKSVKETM